MTSIIIRCIEVFIVVLWAVIGPIFWFPFLVRMIAIFIGTVLVAAGEEGNMSAAQLGLDRAARFYSNGFTNIRESMSAIAKGHVNQKPIHRPVEDFWQPLAIHIFSAAVFWLITAVSVVSVINS